MYNQELVKKSCINFGNKNHFISNKVHICYSLILNNYCINYLN